MSEKLNAAEDLKATEKTRHILDILQGILLWFGRINV